MNDGIGSIVGAAGSVVGRAVDPGGSAGGFALCWDKPLTIPGVDCWPGLRSETSILGGAFVAGGRAMDWWTAILGQDDLLKTLTQAQTAPPGAAGLVFLPFLAGERSPIWDANARGAFLGLTFNHTGAHLARAIVESTGYAMRLLMDPIKEAGARIDELRVCGGQAQSGFWNQIKADITGHTVAVPRLTEVALMGDAICAALGAGLYADMFTAGEAMVGIASRLEPSPANRSIYDTLFDVYRAGYPSLKELFGPLALASGPVS
jgi:xylulokinase